MSELLDNQVDTQNENLNKNFGVHASPCRGCNEKKELEEKTLPPKNFLRTL